MVAQTIIPEGNCSCSTYASSVVSARLLQSHRLSCPRAKRDSCVMMTLDTLGSDSKAALANCDRYAICASFDFCLALRGPKSNLNSRRTRFTVRSEILSVVRFDVRSDASPSADNRQFASVAASIALDTSGVTFRG
jgi:hypothetical protein